MLLTLNTSLSAQQRITEHYHASESVI